MDAHLAVGKILGAWGLKGALKLNLYHPESEAILKTRLIFLKAGFSFEKKEVFSFRRQGKNFVLQLKGLESPEEAQLLRGNEIYILKEDLPHKQFGEFYTFELEGFDVCDETGKSLGSVTSFVHYGASDLLSVQTPQAKEEVLIPFVSDFIVSVSEELKKISVKNIEMFLEND